MENEPPGSESPRPSLGADRPTPSVAGVVAERIGRVPLVGRAAELTRLDAALAASGQDPARLVMLVGEAGIGKSRLLTAAGDRMRGRGGLVAVGRCVDEQGAPPFLPWVDVLAALSDQAERGALAGDGTPQRLDRQLTVQPVVAADLGGPSPEQRKLRIFTTITQSLANFARRRPLLLAFDDLQWADDASHELLRHVVIHAPAVPLVIVGAYRSEEVAGNQALTRTLEELERRRLLTTIRIGPLSERELEQLLIGLWPGTNPPLARVIHRHSEGNPFFAEEVIKTLVDEGRLDPSGDAVRPAIDLADLPLPRGVMAVIGRRLSRLDEASRMVLEMAALAGREISISLLSRAMPATEADVAHCLVEAERAALVRTRPQPGQVPFSPSGSTDEFSFLHDRVRETVTAGIAADRRRLMHARLADAVEAMPNADALARLAAVTYHLRQARQPARAAMFAERLGDAAMRAHAHSDAVRAYRDAIDLGAGSAVTGRGELLTKLGEAMLAATGAAAIAAYREAEAAFAAEGDQAGQARALARRGIAHARNEELDPAVTCLDAAVQTWDALAGNERGPADIDQRIELTQALVELCAILGTSLARFDEAIEAGRRGLALAQAVSERPVLESAARLALSKSLARAGQLRTSQEILTPAPALALRGGDLDLAAEIAGAAANQAYWLGDLAASERSARQRRELARRAGDPFALRHALPWLALISVSRGEWVEAERCLMGAETEIARLDSPEPHAFLHQVAGLLALVQGRYPASVSLFEQAIMNFRQSGPATLIWYVGCLAHAYLAAGELRKTDQIVAETAEILAGLPSGSLPRAPALGQLGIVASWANDRAAMRRWYDELRPFSGQYHWVLIDRVMGMLAARLGQPDAAARHWTAAEAMASRASMRPELAIIAAERAALRYPIPGSDSRDAVTDALRTAIADLREVGMPGEADRYAALLPSSGDSASSPYPAGLTEREVAVLALVARGLTNREIGERLGIAEKTVTNHLTHIFTKANLGNRAAAVAFALRQGLDH